MEHLQEMWGSPEVFRHVVDWVEEEKGTSEEIVGGAIDALGMREPGRMMEEKREGEEMEG